jgi:hypothetical protein
MPQSLTVTQRISTCSREFDGARRSFAAPRRWLRRPAENEPGAQRFRTSRRVLLHPAGNGDAASPTALEHENQRAPGISAWRLTSAPAPGTGNVAGSKGGGLQPESGPSLALTIRMSAAFRTLQPFRSRASRLFVALVLLARLATAQGTVEYERRELKIPMRDGVTLFAVALIPKRATAPLPIILIRTPFSTEGVPPD